MYMNLIQTNDVIIYGCPKINQNFMVKYIVKHSVQMEQKYHFGLFLNRSKIKWKKNIQTHAINFITRMENKRRKDTEERAKKWFESVNHTHWMHSSFTPELFRWRIWLFLFGFSRSCLWTAGRREQNSNNNNISAEAAAAAIDYLWSTQTIITRIKRDKERERRKN